MSCASSATEWAIHRLRMRLYSSGSTRRRMDFTTSLFRFGCICFSFPRVALALTNNLRHSLILSRQSETAFKRFSLPASVFPTFLKFFSEALCPLFRSYVRGACQGRPGKLHVGVIQP